MKKLVLWVLMLQAALTPAAFAKKVELKVGEAPPSYVGVGNDYEKLYIENYAGKVVIVTFWASWCGPCLKELPILDQIQKQAGPDHMKVVAVNFSDSRQNLKKMKRALDDWSVEFASDAGGRIAKSYGVESVPHMFMIGPDGKIAHIHLGYGESSLNGIVDELNALLVEQASYVASEEPPAADQ